jgi:hypothetical protein
VKNDLYAAIESYFGIRDSTERYEKVSLQFPESSLYFLALQVL